MARLDPSSRTLALALAISIALHALVLSIHFRFPDARRLASPHLLEVVLVNTKSRSRPAKPDVLAQANLDRGGNTEVNRRAKTPLPVLSSADPGAEALEARRRQQELEARQQQLLAQMKAQAQVPAEKAKPQLEPRREPQPSGPDLANRALALARLEAQISRNIDDYNKRPRKHFVGARAAEYRFAQYVEDWRQKIERIGNLNYPQGARGRIYGSLRLAVSINPDGTLAGVDLERSSGHKILDAAAERIVQMAAPYSSFPPDIRRDTDILVITRTWHFMPGDRIFSD
ncbi:MAG: energy transducer TonB [Betaproteobacteria bacterium]|nr:energy transducer TonB [Betaproteobacteria bacterium]MBI2961210.1 energy transducer TonB [Betaproteobacteria bacterium]